MEQEADLVIVDNPNENLFIYDFAKENSIDVWLGILENVSKINILPPERGHFLFLTWTDWLQYQWQYFVNLKCLVC